MIDRRVVFFQEALTSVAHRTNGMLGRYSIVGDEDPLKDVGNN